VVGVFFGAGVRQAGDFRGWFIGAPQTARITVELDN